MVQTLESERSSAERSTVLPAAAALGLIAAGISLLRLWLGNRSAITEVLWAEDGLFPLCIHKADFLTCTTQPFAGYLLFLPRTLAWPVSLMPIEQWALTANLIAALLAGIAAFLTFAFARQFGLSNFVATALALLPVIAPMSGLEAINSVGSSYMLLLYVATLGIVFGQTSRGWWWILVVLALISALTIPSTMVLLPVVLVQFLRGRMPRTWAGLVAGALAVGLLAQAWTALTAQTPRSVWVTADTLSSWADSVPTSLLTYWPGLSLGEYSFFTNFTLKPLGGAGWVIVAVLAGIGVVLVAGGWTSQDRSAVVGLLVLSGLAFGLIPSAIGEPNNRYFVVPVLLWGAAALVSLDPLIRRTRWWVVSLVTVLILALWWPALPASAFRATPAPPWTEEVERVKAFCLSDPTLTERPIFSPFWPPNWGDGLDEPTHPNVTCFTVWRWLD